MPSCYPATDYDRPATIVGLLGTFWSEIYAAGGELSATTRGLGAVYRQLVRDLDEVARSIAFATTPLFHVEEWAMYTAHASDAVPATAPYAANTTRSYGDGVVYGPTGVPTSFPVPLNGAVNVTMICDAPAASRVCLVNGVDFTVDAQGVAHLLSSPFSDPRFQPTPVYAADGSITDYELVLWGWRALYDEHALNQVLGGVLGVNLPSTEVGRRLGLALWASALQGTSLLTLRQALAAAADLPTARADGETVTAIGVDARGPFLATDLAVYRYPPTASPVAAVGDVLAAGAPLTTSTDFDESQGPTIPSWIVGVALSPAQLGAAFLDGAVFSAAPAPTTINGTPASPAVTWPVGTETATSAFWASVATGAHGRPPAVAAALTGKSAAPYPVPAEVSPLGFLATNFWSGTTWAARMGVGDAGPDAALGLLSRTIHSAAPPEVLLLLQLESPVLVDNGDDAATRTGVPGAYPAAASPLVETGGPDASTADVVSAVSAPMFFA